ncbi:hypothetical protein AYO38_07060 [bacterium SCGC AG-212-C10]|nr:hypothetical protein AYO38_07060 [bacterium SCGC AG-212-C10]
MSDPSTMAAWFADIKTFFERSLDAGGLIVLHVEPDLWGFMQSRSGSADPTKVPVRVAATGMPELEGLPDTVAGMAQAIVKLRDLYGRNVILGYHFSTWATGIDPFLSNSSESQTGTIARSAATFYLALGARFDLVFSEFSDRDAGFKDKEYKDGGASWWDNADFARFGQLLREFHDRTGPPIVLWQIPLGNTKMRSLNNTRNHY